MYQIQLPDGQNLTVCSLRLQSCVNPTRELLPGGVGVAVLEVTAVCDTAPVTAGTELTLYRDGRQLGIFLAEKPRQSRGRWQLTAYDRASLLEKELGQWLSALPEWPYTLQTLTDKILAACGLTAANTLPALGDWPVQAFTANGITGRVLLQWICQAAGCFCRADPQGRLEFGWFAPGDITVTPTGERFYYMDGFSHGDFVTCPVQKVQVQQTATDVGAVYPDDPEAEHIARITGNYLLTTADAGALEQVAENLYRRLKDCVYTPGQVVTVPGICPGDIFTVTDTAGQSHTLYAMTCTEENGVLTVECTGSYRRDSSQAVNHARYEAVTGRVLELQADVEGLQLENRAASGELAALKLQVEGITATVSRQQTQQEAAGQQFTQLSQTADALALQVARLEQLGAGSVTTATGYTFNEAGLRIAKTGQEMENLLDNTGMYVRRSQEVILQANAGGVRATDVAVGNYLLVGSHARLEDYPENRTACFYIAPQ